MKKVFFSLVLACIAVVASAQISETPVKTFDNLHDYRVEIFTYENGEQIFLAANQDNNEIYFYDLSFELKKSVLLRISNIQRMINLRTKNSDTEIWASEKIFNDDNLLEFIVATDNGFVIVNEEGTEIFNKSYGDGHWNSGKDNFQLLETKNGNLLAVHFFAEDWKEKTEIYALPNYTLPSGIKSNKIQKIGNPFPNPAKTYIQLPYELPYGVKEGIVRVFNTQGKLIKTLSVNDREEFARLDTTNLPSGNYLFSLEVRGERGESKPFIVAK